MDIKEYNYDHEKEEFTYSKKSDIILNFNWSLSYILLTQIKTYYTSLH